MQIEDEKAREWYTKEAFYKTYLPTEEQLKVEIETQKTIFELQQQEKNENSQK